MTEGADDGANEGGFEPELLKVVTCWLNVSGLIHIMMWRGNL